MMQDIQEKYSQYLNKLQNINKYRKLKIQGQAGNCNLVDFSTNDYLNLSRNERLLQYAYDIAKEIGVGARGSRLLAGNSQIYMDFEQQIALDKKTEKALIFSSGFQANLTTLAALLDHDILGQRPLVFFDKYNHASLYQAVFLSGAELVRYKHNDMQYLYSMLEKYKNIHRPKFIVSESIFGMDGDIAPLQQLCEFARIYGALLYIDEAHATGVFGKEGYGFSPDLNLTDLDYVIMGSFSKALGGSGGYIASSALFCDYIVNKASGFIYSTAPSPLTVGASYAAWNMVRNLQHERRNLLHNARFLRNRLIELGYDIGKSETHIVPIILKDELTTLKAQDYLARHNILTSSIRPPTVPPNSSRLRLALHCGHNLQHIEYLLEKLQKMS